ncbi:MAG: hypothetical protein M3Q76_03630, partial [Acidobacteriota bacterium]|nr:hypothetical protein [Acidobacteriota bacterium]
MRPRDMTEDSIAAATATTAIETEEQDTTTTPLAAAPSELRIEHEQRQQKQREEIHELDKETLHHLLHQMVLIRRFEEKAAEAYTLGKIGGFCHLY